MHTQVTQTNNRCIHAQSNYTNTKLKAWFRRLLRHPARKRSDLFYTSTHLDPHEGQLTLILASSLPRFVSHLVSPCEHIKVTKLCFGVILLPSSVRKAFSNSCCLSAVRLCYRHNCCHHNNGRRHHKVAV